MATHVVVIERWKPVSVNRLLAGHWSKGYRLKRADRELLGFYLLLTRVPKAQGKRRVSIHVEQAGRGRLVDPDNVLKATLDGLVHAGALVDDSARWCEIGTVTVSRGVETRTTVTLEDLT